MKFVKMHSCGNDIIILNKNIDSITAKKIGDRRYGIGCDQIMCIDYPNSSVHIWNSDGSIAAACGNGYRCIAQYLIERKMPIINSIDAYIEENGMIGIAYDIPTTLQTDKFHNFEYTIVETGNKHLIVYSDLATPIDAINLSKIIEEEINVSIISELDYSDLDNAFAKVYVHERGAGATMSCATAACAIFWFIREKINPALNKIEIRMLGGSIFVRYDDIRNKVIHSAYAEETFTGYY